MQNFTCSFCRIISAIYNLHACALRIKPKLRARKGTRDVCAIAALQRVVTAKMSPGVESKGLSLSLFHTAFCCCLLALVSCTSFAKPLDGVFGAVGSPAEPSAVGSVTDQHIYWPDSAEDGMEPLFSEEDRRILAEKMRTLRVVSLGDGCGRMKNRLVTLEDGTRVCVRYRESGNQLRGDLYAYHFNRLLGMWNVPPTVAVKLDLTGKQWKNVSKAAMKAGWKSGVSIIASQVVDGLEDEYFPQELLDTSSALPLTEESSAASSSVRRLMEWTDMILFDYIIGHNDRLFNALLNSKWNSRMMEKPVHNLKKMESSSDLVLLDNESGFDFGYIAAEQKEEYRLIQIAFLERICVFRRPTISSLRKLGSVSDADRDTPSPSALLENYIRQVDLPSFTAVRKWRAQSQTEFDARVERTLERVHECALLVNR